MTDARIIDGKVYSQNVRDSVAAEVAELKAKHGLTPGLAVVLVGEDAASQIYVRNKGKQTEECGMLSVTRRLPADTAQGELVAIVKALNADPDPWHFGAIAPA